MKIEGQIRIPSGCAISAVISRTGERMSGGSIIESMRPMHERSNGPGGVIIVLGLGGGEGGIVGNYPCTGMHGGRMFLRSDCANIRFPKNVTAAPASPSDMAEIKGYLSEYCSLFNGDKSAVLDAQFTKIVPDSKNPYKQMYVAI